MISRAASSTNQVRFKTARDVTELNPVSKIQKIKKERKEKIKEKNYLTFMCKFLCLGIFMDTICV